jgi:thioredoxin 1
MGIAKVDSNGFDEAVYDNFETCLVAFTKKECHVCKDVFPRVEEIHGQFEGKMSFYSVDVEDEKDLYKRFSLKGVPQLLFFKDGEFEGKLAGDVDEDDIQEKIEELI